MHRLLISTVGTSLLTNRDDDRPWKGWKHGDQLPDPAAVDAWLARADPVAASAETNTLRAVGLDGEDRVRLLHSDTPEGRFCSARLATYLAARCRGVDERPLRALGYQHLHFAQAGLRSLVQEAFAAIHDARKLGLEPLLCATGGFKAEIAFLNLLGALLGVEVCYIHEQFREVVRLPRLPLAWDTAFVLDRRDFFEWIDAQPRPGAEVEGRLRGRPELRPLVEDGDDGNSYLNAAGDLLYRAAREQAALGPAATWPPPDPRPPDEKLGLSDVEHHRPPGWEGFVRRLASIDCVRRVAYDPSALTGPAVRVVDAAAGDILLRYQAGGKALPLRVGTTARGEAQAGLVAKYLLNRLR